MRLKPALNNPITVSWNSHGGHSKYYDKNRTIEGDLSNGAVFSSSHYGFILITNKTGEEEKKFYPTQCPIYGLQIVDGVLNIFEEGKYVSWQFRRSGEMLQTAKFLETRDYEYLVNHGMDPQKTERINKLTLRRAGWSPKKHGE